MNRKKLLTMKQYLRMRVQKLDFVQIQELLPELTYQNLPQIPTEDDPLEDTVDVDFEGNEKSAPEPEEPKNVASPEEIRRDALRNIALNFGEELNDEDLQMLNMAFGSDITMEEVKNAMNDPELLKEPEAEEEKDCDGSCHCEHCTCHEDEDKKEDKEEEEEEEEEDDDLNEITNGPVPLAKSDISEDLDFENCGILSISEDSMVISAGGDWQPPVTMTVTWDATNRSFVCSDATWGYNDGMTTKDFLKEIFGTDKPDILKGKDIADN